MELLLMLLCEGHLCPRNAPPFRRPWAGLTSWHE